MWSMPPCASPCHSFHCGWSQMTGSQFSTSMPWTGATSSSQRLECVKLHSEHAPWDVVLLLFLWRSWHHSRKFDFVGEKEQAAEDIRAQWFSTPGRA